jgi:hypothetical protein
MFCRGRTRRTALAQPELVVLTIYGRRPRYLPRYLPSKCWILDLWAAERQTKTQAKGRGTPNPSSSLARLQADGHQIRPGAEESS